MHILGASGHAKVILDILEASSQEIEGCWDDRTDLSTFCGVDVKGTIRQFIETAPGVAIIAIGNNTIRKLIAGRIKGPFGRAIHPSSVVAPSSIIGIGTVIMPLTAINAGTHLGMHVIINTSASVDHDCQLASFVHISPQVGLAGNVIVGEGSHIGIGATVIQGVKIGKWVTIGAGTVVIRDVPDYAVVVGNPGRIIKYNEK